MTVREIYDGVLVELNKENSQSFTIEEFNYVINKTVLAMANDKYNFYAVNAQLTDDLRVLMKTQTFKIQDTVQINGSNSDEVFNATSSYVLSSSSGGILGLSTVRDLTVGDTVTLGKDGTPRYIIYTITLATNSITLYDIDNLAIAGTIAVPRGANIYVLQSAAIPMVDNDYVKDRTVDVIFKSSDYFHIDNCKVIWRTRKPSDNSIIHLPFSAKRLTNDMSDAILYNAYLSPAPVRPYYQLFDNFDNSGVISYGTDYKAIQNKPRVKFHVGNKNNAMELRQIEVNYLKLPEPIFLNDSDVFYVGQDVSQVLEFPDYLKNEIIRRCTICFLEKESDPRIQTQPMFNQDAAAIPMNMQMDTSSRQRQYAQQQNNQTNQ